MIVASIVLCNTLFLKASVKNKCVGFVLERLVGMENIKASFRVRKEFMEQEKIVRYGIKKSNTYSPIELFPL